MVAAKVLTSNLMSLTANHFELFNLPLVFDLDIAVLAHRYRDLQRMVHPDNFVQASERDRRLAMQKTSQINEAYQTLKNPLRRAQYLLQLQGIQWDTVGDTAMDAEFLLEQMELREELGEMKEQAQPPKVLTAFIQRLENRTHALTEQLSQQFAGKDYAAARESVRQFQFFLRLREEALTLEEQFL